MAIEIADIEHLANLARIAVSDEERSILQHDLEGILAYVSQIKEVVAEAPVSEAGELRNVLRDDESPRAPGTFTEAMLVAAPAREGARISVKKIL